MESQANVAWLRNFAYLFFAVACLYLAQHLVSSIFRVKNRTEIWSKLETVGIPSKFLFPWMRAFAGSITSTREYAAEGYNKFSKAMKQPFALPTTWTGRALVVLPPSVMHQILTRPDQMPGSSITNIFGLIETIQLPYIISDPDIYMNALHFDVVRRKMTKKDMHAFVSMTAEEIDLAFRDIWGTSKEWTTINGWDTCGQVIARTAERMMIGLPMGRDKNLLKVSRLYAQSVLLGGAVMNCFPPLLRRVIGPCIALRAKYYQTRCARILIPVIEERIRIWRDPKRELDAPGDFLQWLVETCAKDGLHQLDAQRIANRLIALMTPLIFAVCYMFSHSVLDLYGSPAREEYIEGLEAECKGVTATHNNLSTVEAVDSLYRIDSTIRESMRVSDVAVVNLYRDVTSGELDIGNGVKVPQGVRMAFPTQNIHLDPDNYDDSRSFDAFRFSRKFEGIDERSQHDAPERELITTPTLSFLPLGYGRHACPGRWFAANTMKQALAYIVMNYDVELVGRPIQRKALLNTMVPPVDKQIRIRRKS